MNRTHRTALMAGAVVFGLISLISLTIVVILQQRRINATSATASNTNGSNTALTLGPIPTTEAPFPSPAVTAGADLDVPTPAPVVRTRAPTTEPSTKIPAEETITTAAPSQAPIVTPAPTPDDNVPISTLDDCLVATGVPILVRPSDGASYMDAKTCLVFPPTDYNAQPLAIVQPTSAAQVAAVVQCAKNDGSITVSARSGAHSYVAGSCRGEVVVDLQQLGGVSVDSANNEVTWGAGLVHGQLYGPLWEDHRLLVAGGTENMVGTGGLWLGCGRGLLTQAYGYSCDHLLAIEYVDAQGQVQRVEKDDEDDMLWMARGGGGFFPGIVTSFTAQAFPAPDTVERTICYYPNNPTVLREAMHSFVQSLDEWNNPDNQLFAAIIVQRPHIEMEFFCYGCSAAQRQHVSDLRTALFRRVSSATPDCTVTIESYGDFLLDRATWDLYDDFDDVHVRSTWPEWFDRFGVDLHGSAYSGGLLVPDDYDVNGNDAAWIDEVVNYWDTLPGNAGERTFLDFLSIYPMRGKGSPDDASTAFGSRGAQAVVHFKSTNIDDMPEQFKQHMDQLEERLVSVHGFPCRGFYNYQDEDLACANTDDEYLDAFFSDPDRLKRILSEQDPDGVFYRLRLR